MNIYLTENSEITNFVWAKAEHWWPRVIPYKLHDFIFLGELTTYICHKAETRKISINEFGCGQFPIIYNIVQESHAVPRPIKPHCTPPRGSKACICNLGGSIFEVCSMKVSRNQMPLATDNE
jgi:hypothetical protein